MPIHPFASCADDAYASDTSDESIDVDDAIQPDAQNGPAEEDVPEPPLHPQLASVPPTDPPPSRAQDSASTRRLKTRLATKATQIAELKDTLRHTRRASTTAKDHAAQLETQLAEAHRATAALRAELDSRTALLDARTQELRAAQVFLSTADAVADADVRAAVERLNAETYQIAAGLAAEPSTDRAAIDRAEADAAAVRAIPLVGETTVARLRGAPRAPNAMVVQGALAAAAHDAMHTLAPGPTGKGGTKLLHDVYQHMWHAEPQAVAGRWRALACRHLSAVGGGAPDAGAVAGAFAQSLADVLLLAGVPRQVRRRKLADVQERLAGVAASVVALRTTIGEDVVASDILPVLEKPGVSFDPQTMEDAYAYAPGESSAPGRVVCAVEIGLRRWEKRMDGQQAPPVWLMKPKVALESMFDELDESSDVDQSSD
ncbi:hypothetical protein B0H21DRAFT_825798 [Amylocystis lapponica]|nr:hypothetical protein B0H21DRAFT_825798 [Amylocystis lapponica]